MTLSYSGEQSVGFKAGWRRWLSIKRFISTPADAEVRRLLAELMSHTEYGDGYCSQKRSGSDVHAKWLIAELESSACVACAASEVWASLKSFSSAPGADDPEGKRRFDKLVDEVLRTPGEFWALDAPSSAEHEWAWILDDFREFVWISGARDELRLIVAASD